MAIPVGHKHFAELVGLDEMREMFKALATTYDKKIFKQELLKIAEALSKKVSDKAPRATKSHWLKLASDTHVRSGARWSWVTPGSLKKSIVAKTPKKARKGRQISYVKVQYSIAPHAHLIEYGHYLRKTKGGPILKKIKANPFFRDTWTKEKNTVEKQIKEAAQKILFKRIEILRRKHKT